jgi:hypothetical protein
VKRVEKFIRTCSNNYKKDCYILKLDIQGFFMSINKDILWEKLVEFLENRTSPHPNPPPSRGEVIDQEKEKVGVPTSGTPTGINICRGDSCGRTYSGIIRPVIEKKPPPY